MRTLDVLRKARRVPAAALAKEARRRALSRGTQWGSRQWDRYLPTYSKAKKLSLATALPALELEWTGSASDAWAGVCRHYLQHRFDLLGSGWTLVAYGRTYRGTEGRRFAAGPSVYPDAAGAWLEGRVNNSNIPREAKSALVSKGYQPIDWHVDFKSGYRWPSTTWYRDVVYGSVPGADVKVPWELARAQHLPRLAIAYGAASKGDARFLPAERYLSEVRDQILDFIATNPPRYGVNWRCTMDVGIRVANWVVACDILRSHGAGLGSKFLAVLATSVAEHARFIAANLEWRPVFRSNHYLADICGLAFAAAYLEDAGSERRPPDADRWLAMAARELAAETESQFNPDGSNKEASVSYHRLSSEMVMYTTALLSDVGATPEWTKRQLALIERALGFTAWVVKDGREAPQIGDNDSGRFFALAPSPKAMTVAEAKKRWANLEGYDELAEDDVYWAHDTLDHSPLMVAGEALLVSKPARRLGQVISAELSWSAGMGCTAAADAVVKCRRRWRGAPLPIGTGPEGPRSGLEVSALEGAGTHDIVRWRIDPGSGVLTEGLDAVGFPDFGLFILRSSRIYLAIRCGPVGQSGAGGHSHNDQLGLELEIDGSPWFRDPGSYLYTPAPTARNLYRSAQAHLVPRRGGAEPGDLQAGLFVLPERTHAHCLWFSSGGFAGAHYGYGLPTVREVRVNDRRRRPRWIGQVHRAVWKDGRRVAVKIQYPGAGKALINDFTQLAGVGPLFGLLMPGLDVKPLLDELRDRVAEETRLPPRGRPGTTQHSTSGN